MQVFYSSKHISHTPPFEIFNGQAEQHQEVPARIERILTALHGTSHNVIDKEVNPHERGKLLQTLQQIHTADYINYLQNTDFNNGYTYPSVFPYRPISSKSLHPVAQRGYYSFDTYTPLSNTTFNAALESAYLAFCVSHNLLKSGQVAYALCRPPGHHAESEKMGGYCYFNNGAVAAQVLANASTNNKVAILDVDFHHGNGAEQIFANRTDVITISIHADPNEKFPYFSGQQTTEQQANFNFPLPLGTNNVSYNQTLNLALDIIKQENATHLVVCFGADTHEQDPIGGFKLSTPYYKKMATRIANLNLPTLILQEGGYNTNLLGTNVVTFLSGFE